MKVKQKKELAKVIAKLASKKDSDTLTVKDFKNYVKAQKNTVDEQSAEMQELANLSEQAAEEIHQSTRGPEFLKNVRALRAKEKVQEEYKTIKSGVKSRGEGIFRALGLGDAEAKLLGKVFGKKLTKEEKEAGEKKFKIGEKTQAQKSQDKKEKITADRLKKVFENTKKTLDILYSLRSTIEGIANKLRASPAKEAPKSKKDMRKMERQAGLKYSKESGRYKDVKTGKFVSHELARQRMNISPTAIKETAAAGAPAPHALESKTLEEKAITKEVKDPNTEKIDKIGKQVGDTKKELEDLASIFDISRVGKWLGTAIGAAVPFLVDGAKWLWENIISPGMDFGMNIAKQIGNWLSDVEILGTKPFAFLKSEKPKELPKPAGAKPAAPAPSPAAPAAPPPAAPAPAAAGGGAPTATPTGSNMPAATPPSGPPRRLGPAAAKRGQVNPEAAKNAALAAAAKYGITGKHLAQFMAQVQVESGNFTRVEENLRYSAKRLMEIFPKYYKSQADAEADAQSPINIANRVYGGRMGNGPPESGDGYKYRGRGLIQLTGKDNYAKFGKIVGMDLVNNPESAGDLATAADIAAAFYKKNVVDAGIDADNTGKVTKAINGGSIGLSERAAAYANFQKDSKSLQATGPAPAPNLIAAGANEAPPAAGRDVAVGGTAAPVEPTPSSSGQEIATATTEAQGAAPAAPAAPVVVPSPAGRQPQMPPQRPNNAQKASVRSDEGSYVRAIAKDFAHPSTFTLVTLL